MSLRELSNESLHFRVQQLLAEYVELIDEDRLEQWPALFVERAVYRVVPRENAERGLPAAAIFCDSRGMLVDRVVSLRQANIYAVHQHRHLLGNLRIVERGDDAVRAQCNYVVFQTRVDGRTSIYSAGKYEDRIVVDEGRLRFSEKLVTFDTYRIDSLMVRPL
jgi:anthranilate 1,2-dioxygenase small subunit